MIQYKRKNRFRFCIFPGYNWCGPGCNGPGAPINALDAACKAHDECYLAGLNRHDCDRDLLHGVKPLINPYTVEGRHARTIYNIMKAKTFFNYK